MIIREDMLELTRRMTSTRSHLVRLASDKERWDESEEVYRYLVVTISPTDEEQVAGLPMAGFLYLAFTNRSTDMVHVNVYHKDGFDASALVEVVSL